MNRIIISSVLVFLAALVIPAAAQAQTDITPGASAVTASANDGNVPANTVDGSLATRWSANGDGAWIRFDLGATRSVGSVRLAFFNGDQRRSRFDLQVAAAADGPWTDVRSGLESSGTSTAEETFDFPDTSARFVRYLGHGNSVNGWNSLTEVRLLAGGGGCARTINVATSAALAAAASGARAGDCIVVANGNYAAFTTGADGTAASPIVIRAANRGRAVITSGMLRLNGARHVTIEGFKITSPGAGITIDNQARKIILNINASNNCRVTRCDFKPTTHPSGTTFLMLNGNSNDNRIDHCDFGPNTVRNVKYIWPTGSNVIPGVTPPADRGDWANYQSPVNPNISRRTRIDHNFIHDKGPGTGEPIVLGGIGVTGDYQNLGTIVEQNLFQNAHGDAEIISVKSSNNVIRNNTIRTSEGGFTSRAGNMNEFSGNFILQGGKSGSAAIRVYEKDHKIFNNYIDNPVDGTIQLSNGDAYSDATFSHARSVRVLVAHNTIVNINNNPVFIGHADHRLTPLDCVFANNILMGSAATLVREFGTPVITYSHNIAWPTAGGSLGIPASSSEFLIANPLLASMGGILKLTPGSPAVGFGDARFFPFIADDIDGQRRAAADVGADELSSNPILRRPLSAADVGPNAP